MLHLAAPVPHARTCAALLPQSLAPLQCSRAAVDGALDVSALASRRNHCGSAASFAAVCSRPKGQPAMRTISERAWSAKLDSSAAARAGADAACGRAESLHRWIGTPRASRQESRHVHAAADPGRRRCCRPPRHQPPGQSSSSPSGPSSRLHVPRAVLCSLSGDGAAPRAADGTRRQRPGAPSPAGAAPARGQEPHMTSWLAGMGTRWPARC